MSAILARQTKFCSRHGIRLATGRSKSWLVWSAELPYFPAVLLGRIEESEDEFVLVQIQSGFRWSRVGSFDEALLRLVRGFPQPGDEDRLGRKLKRGKSRSVLRATDETVLGLASPSILSAAPGTRRTETAVRVANS
jgi:hypothetical protein